jgi:hypothetical protein
LHGDVAEVVESRQKGRRREDKAVIKESPIKDIKIKKQIIRSVSHQ